jgi:hypothetical protein
VSGIGVVGGLLPGGPNRKTEGKAYREAIGSLNRHLG